jgi:hypothetical protein
VWKRVYLRPSSASFSTLGVWHGPPKALDAPKPTSSSKMITTFGAPSGGRRGSIGGKLVSGSLASYVVTPGRVLNGIGNCARKCLSGWVDIISLLIGYANGTHLIGFYAITL